MQENCATFLFIAGFGVRLKFRNHDEQLGAYNNLFHHSLNLNFSPQLKPKLIWGYRVELL